MTRLHLPIAMIAAASTGAAWAQQEPRWERNQILVSDRTGERACTRARAKALEAARSAQALNIVACTCNHVMHKVRYPEEAVRCVLIYEILK